LVAAFRATLEEVLEADIILHVRDISHPATEEQAEDVEKILESLGISEDIPQLEVWNKVDLIDVDDRDALGKIAERNDHILTISAMTGQGLDELVSRVSTHLTRDIIVDDIHLPYPDARARAWLFEQGVVECETQAEDGSLFHLRWNAKQKAKFEKSFGITYPVE
jgi:GTP-binding protein HflX